MTGRCPSVLYGGSRCKPLDTVAVERAAALGQGIIRVYCHTHMAQLGMAETVTGPTIDNHAAPDTGAYRDVDSAPATPGSTLHELRQPRCVDITVDCDGDANSARASR